MGAYYAAAINETKYSTYLMDTGAKLMEHSYIENTYCKAVEAKLLNNPQKLVWLCDYHDPDPETTELDWETTEDGFIELPDSYSNVTQRYFINHTKKVYIDVAKLALMNQTEWKIHPLPILCNSDVESQGGGDYHRSDSRRALWCEDTIEVVLDKDLIPTDYVDVTTDSVFKE